MIQKTKIAFFGVGLVGIPLLNQILTRLSEDYDITIYSFMRVDPACIPPGIRFRSVPNHLHQRIKYLVLMLRFTYDHLRSPYKVLHAQSAFPGGVLARRLGKLFGIRWIVTLIGGETEWLPHVPFGDLRGCALRPLTKEVCRDASLLSVMSRYQAELAKKNLKIDRDVIALPYAPVVRPWRKKECTLPLKLLHVAYHHPVKNHSMLLRCIDIIRREIDVRLVIVGANYGSKFRQEIENLSLTNHVTIAGPVSSKEMGSFYDKAQILIHTSWYEGLPAVAIEAMACSLPVCGTKVGIIADFANSFTIGVDVDDAVSLAKEIIRISKDPQRYEQMRADAYRWVMEHDQSYFINELKRHYDRLTP
ncbi:MAG TPA: glycosyltransferase family 4 protein [Chryseosolibacter sp.]|nr:glycosyltransferase family 4 protein [Chryseosolibacter sp.]